MVHCQLTLPYISTGDIPTVYMYSIAMRSCRSSRPAAVGQIIFFQTVNDPDGSLGAFIIMHMQSQAHKKYYYDRCCTSTFTFPKCLFEIKEII